MNKLRKLLPHQSAVRLLVSESKGRTYEAFKTLDEVRADPDGAVVFEGDSGGTIYLTVPASKVFCGEEALKQMLADIDAMCWNDKTSRGVFFEHLSVGSGVIGGMGGGIVIDRLWLHPKIEGLGIQEEIRAVLNGSQERISSLDKRWK